MVKIELKNLSFLKKSLKFYGTIFELIVRKKISMHRKSLIFKKWGVGDFLVEFFTIVTINSKFNSKKVILKFRHF